MAEARRCRGDVPGTETPEGDVEQLVGETLEEALPPDAIWSHPQRGRPSLTGKPTASPHVGFRVSPELRRHADALARQQGITLSQLARDALEKYVRGA